MWPYVEFGHIYCYIIQRSGVYTQEELLQQKSLEAYNYSQSGIVNIWTTSFEQCVLYTKVNLSMRSLEKAHKCWIAVKCDGRIITTHCKCIYTIRMGSNYLSIKRDFSQNINDF